jgi:Predicted RNA-binding protein containing a PIN domain
MKHYFIDGYNLMFRLQGKKTPSLHKKREEIISALNEEATLFRLNITLVFDGAEQAPEEGTRTHYDTLEIVYTSKKQSADAYILEQLEYSKDPSSEIVITSDRELAGRAKMLGAATETIEAFLSFMHTKHAKRKTQSPEEVKMVKDTKGNLERLLKIFEDRSKKEL